jgi:cold shock protein
VTGTVKFFNPERGYGFIKPDGGGDDVFVHVTALKSAGMSGIYEGQRLGYRLTVDRHSGKTLAVDLEAR